MLSAGNGLKISCGDVIDKETRRIAGISVSKALLGRWRIFRKNNGLRRRKMPYLDQYRKDPGNKALLLKLLHGVSWEKLDRGFQRMFSMNLRGSSVARWIAKRYNSRKINSVQTATVWRQVFQNRPNTSQCRIKSPGTPSRPTPLPRPRPRPVTPTPSRPRPANIQIARQNVLLAAVRAVYGASKSESYVKTVLKTQKWRTLKGLGVASAIMKGFAGLGYRRAGRIERVARRLVKKTLRKWKSSSGTAQPVTHPRRPVARPVTPAPSPVRPRPHPAGNQIALQKALVAAVRKVYGASKSESYVKSVLKTQSWNTLKQLGIAADVQKAFGKLGYAKAARSARYAQKLLKKTLKHWK